MRPKTAPRTDLLTLAEVAERLRIKPGVRSVRAALRKLGVPVLELPARRAVVDAATLDRAIAAQLRAS